jgi:protein O-GlcNAc transferase
MHAGPRGERVQPTQPEKDALIALFREGRHAEANAAARAMTRLYPKALDGWNIRGASARALGRLHEAEKSFRELERLAPAFAGAPYNLALVFEDRGADQDAAAAYARAIALDAGLAQAHNNLGSVLLRLGDVETALTHLERAALFQPGWPEVHNSHGNALKAALRFEEARAAYSRAIEARGDFAKAHYNLGVLESELGNREAAVAALRRALAIEPDNALARAALIAQLAWLCDWPAIEEHREHISRLGVSGPAVPPWPMLALEDAPQRQLVRARNWAARHFAGHDAKSAAAQVAARPRARPQRLKLAYFSADFHDHPCSRLVRGLMRCHDRDRFEVHAFSYGPRHDDPYRREAEASVDHFHDVAGWPSARIVELAHACRLDIAVDRQGYTTDSRAGLFRHRLAPVQMEYLGFPGTVAAPLIDYMVVDPVTVPDSHRAHYAEKLIRLPHTYAPFDNEQPIDPHPPSRRALGLPESGCVLCCFNATYKITPREYDIWMRIMRRTPGSVLWLFRSNAGAAANLRREAERRGVDAQRIIFAERVPNPAHLARHACADLFIDTFAMNAHTTTAEALWAGLPVVTRIGDQFGARVAASLLEAAGLGELITRGDEAYEALILELANDPAHLAAKRAKLARNRTCAALFDTALYTRHLEAGFDAAYDRFVKGRPPADIEIAGIARDAPA